MRGSRLKRIAVLLLCVALPYLKTSADRRAAGGAVYAMDFGTVYYGARCTMEHRDPYDPQAVLSVFTAEGGEFPDPATQVGRVARVVITRIIYPPTAFLLVAPLAMLRWPVALALWLGLMAGLLALAGYLVWDLSCEAPAMAGWMTGFMLLNSLLLLWLGNPAGIAVPLCVIAAWCFLKHRFAWAGVTMMAIALLLKPHDAGLVWLYFLLAGGKGRKRALQTVAVTAMVGLGAVLWVGSVSPHWIGEMRGNMNALSSPGSFTDPGPSGVRFITAIVNLQNSISIFKNDPHFYNPLSYLLGGILILIWAVAVLRKRWAREGALLALAAASMLTMLPEYHRTYDAKLLLLAIPACALLWAGGGARRWVALGLTAAAILVTSDLPDILVNATTGSTALSGSSMGGMLKMLALQPAPLVLLAGGCFYLWTYIQYEPSPAGMMEACGDSTWKAEAAT
jgi:hypothetical protein